MHLLSSVQRSRGGQARYAGRVRILASILLVLLFVPGWSGAERLPLWGAHPTVRAEPVALGPGLRPGMRLGKLTWLGGVALSSDDPAFGGYSSIAVSDRSVLMLSDGGLWLSLDRAKLTRARFGVLPGGPGAGWKKEDRDSESLAIDPRTGQAWVGFENAQAIWRYAPGFARVERHVVPPAMADWPENGGPESLVRLRDGQFVAISELGRWPGARRQTRAAILFVGDPTIAPRRGFRFSYRPPRGFDPSDAAELPNGDLVIVNRRFELPYRFITRLVIVDRRQIRPGATVEGRVIATLAPPDLHDNFEGVAVRQESGRTELWLVSDDNQSLLQRTLLLRFALDP